MARLQEECVNFDERRVMRSKIVMILLTSCFTLSVIGQGENNKEIILEKNTNLLYSQPVVSLNEENVEDIENTENVETEPEENEYITTVSEDISIKFQEIDFIEDRKDWFLAYKNIFIEYSEIFDPPETIYDQYSDEEIKYMWKCIETEAFDQDFESKCNIANVILNRLESEKFSDNPIAVITAKNQFAYGRSNITEDTKLALEYAFLFADTTDGSLYFESGNNDIHSNYADYIFTDGAGHHFYK